MCIRDSTHISPCEQVEAKYPILFECHALRQDSGGAGKYRGGLGTEQIVKARAPIMANLRMDRVHCKPWGLAGGMAAMGNEAALRIDGKDITDLPNGKVAQVRLKAGDHFVYRAGGGGGFGPPRERDTKRVADDVRQGYVSRKAAEEHYGVSVNEDGVIDEAKTRSNRGS